MEDKPSKQSKWTEWVIPLIAVVVTGLVALAEVGSSLYTDAMNKKTEISLKQYEITFIEKQKAYATFFDDLTSLYLDSTMCNYEKMVPGFQKLTLDYYSIEPFLDKETREDMYYALWDFQLFCGDEVCGIYGTASEEQIDEMTASFVSWQEAFHDKLYPQLFEDILP